MSIFNFLQGLRPTGETSQVIRNIDNIKKTIDKQTLPSATALAEICSFDYKFKNKDMATLNAALVKELPTAMGYKLRSPNMVLLVTYGLEKLTGNLSIISDLVPKIFKGEAFSTSVLTYSKANVMQYVECAAFFVRYARTLLNYVSCVELASVQGVVAKGGFGPDDLKFLNERRFDFIRIATAMTMEMNKTKDTIKQLSDMVITPTENDSVNVVVGKSRINPFGFSNLPFPMSLIWRLRLNEVDAEISEYEAAKEEANAIEYRIILMREHIERGHGDAATERTLELTEARLMGVKRKIERMEKEYGLD